MRKIATALLATVCIVGFCLTATGGEVEKLPPSGKAKFQVSYVQYAGRDAQLDDNAGFGTFEFSGVTRNVEGKSWFDRMTEHCTGQYYYAPTASTPTNGSCLYVDADGDKVMVNWTGTEPYDGTKHIVGGTGKYAGITGDGTFDGTQLKAPAEAWIYF